MKFKYAIRAFWCIITDKKHVFSDGEKYSAIGTTRDIMENLDIIAEATCDDANQQLALIGYKKILENEI